jgi:hypothetical protein
MYTKTERNISEETKEIKLRITLGVILLIAGIGVFIATRY